MNRLPLGAHRPGTTPLHRLPAGAKLAAMFVLGVVVVALQGWRASVAALVVALGVAVVARVGLLGLWRGLRPLLLVVALLGAFRWWQDGWPVAVESVTTILALVVLSVVLVTTTAVDDLLDAIVRALGPFPRLGVHPEKVALAFSLTLRAIPEVFAIYGEAREAARARGLERSPRAILVPTAVRTVAHAHRTGDALAARGLGDD